ncbi:NB-ARC domain-containing protein [Cladophialophora immunda]|nr:NB-ARC domain-containing protein [Cladophialophora immunda]
MGKTQVALEYTHRYGDFYDYIFWVRAETGLEMIKDIITISDKLNLEQPKHGGDGAIIDKVRTWFETTTDRKWLLVFDNVEDMESLTPYRPRLGHGSLLLTSQNAGLRSQTTHNIPLKPFGEEEGASFLLKQLNGEHPPTENDDAISLCKELGGLPLAIAHVAGYMAESDVSVKDTLDMFTQRRESAEIFNTKPDTTFVYSKALDFVWDVALRELVDDTLRLMHVLSMLNPEGVPEEMQRGDHLEQGLSFLNSWL